MLNRCYSLIFFDHDGPRAHTRVQTYTRTRADTRQMKIGKWQVKKCMGNYKLAAGRSVEIDRSANYRICIRRE